MKTRDGTETTAGRKESIGIKEDSTAASINGGSTLEKPNEYANRNAEDISVVRDTGIIIAARHSTDKEIG